MLFLSIYVVSAAICCAVLATKGHDWWIGLFLGTFGPIGIGLALWMRGGRAAAAPPPAPGSRWAPDPTRRHEHRLFDGVRWTGHVSDRGVSGWDPMPLPPPSPGTAHDGPPT